MDGRAGWILVGIDGGEAGRAAVEYAVRQAARSDMGVRLLHVAPEMAETVTVDPENAGTGWRHRQKILDTAVGHACDLLDASAPDRIITDVAFGGRVDRLVEASTDCALVVLGDQRRPELDRLATGSVLAGVAARCPVPVIGVPAGWTSVPSDPLVIAAVKRPAESEDLLGYASDAAAACGARLRVLHARAARHGAPGHRSSAEHALRAELAARVSTHACDHEGVPIDIDVVCGHPARVVVDASARADLVVISRRPLVGPRGHLGRTGRAVLRGSRCPVVVLPSALPAPRVDGLGTDVVGKA